MPRTFSFNLNTQAEVPTSLTLNTGESVYIVGANGTGKSAMMNQFNIQTSNQAIKISAHRQIWFKSNTIQLTSQSRLEQGNNLRSFDAAPQSRWKDDYNNVRSQFIIYDLVDAMNVLGRRALELLRDNPPAATALAAERTPVEKMNRILNSSNLPLTISIESNDKIFVSKNGGTKYSIAELSDGEKNALLMCATVLTAPENSLFLVDEPERHLHRSITSPLLTELFGERLDCAFVIATHDIGLVSDSPASKVLMIRSCSWANATPTWDADIIEESDQIDPIILRDILGAKRKILFVEGIATSLDASLYSILYPEFTVIPKGSCNDVSESVSSLRALGGNYAWVEPKGIVDSDNLTAEEIESLRDNDVFAVPFYSIESIYYHPIILQAIAFKVENIQGLDHGTLLADYETDVIRDLRLHRERLCARLSERKIVHQVHLPNWHDVMNNTHFSPSINMRTIYDAELQGFNAMTQQSNVAGLIQRYPIRETPLINNLVNRLRQPSRADYERMVRKLIVDDDTLKRTIRGWFGI